MTGSMASRVEQYGEVARQLNQRIAAIAPEILPRGYRERRYWRCGGLDGQEGQSLAVRLDGGKQGRWRDYNGGAYGDALDLVAGVLFGGNKRQAFEWACQRLGRPDPGGGASPASRGAAKRHRDVDYFASVLRYWNEALRLRRGDPVDLYLKGRGIDLAKLARAPGALRFHHAVWNTQTGRYWPAMLAAIAAPNGRLRAIHWTWLTPSRSGFTKAPIPDRRGRPVAPSAHWAITTAVACACGAAPGVRPGKTCSKTRPCRLARASRTRWPG